LGHRKNREEMTRHWVGKDLTRNKEELKKIQTGVERLEKN